MLEKVLNLGNHMSKLGENVVSHPTVLTGLVTMFFKYVLPEDVFLNPIVVFPLLAMFGISLWMAGKIKIDKNNDGRISADELEAYFMSVLNAGQSHQQYLDRLMAVDKVEEKAKK